MVIEWVDVVVQLVLQFVGTSVSSRFWFPEVGDLPEDVLETEVVCHTL
jgi:hypothetical protein